MKSGLLRIVAICAVISITCFSGGCLLMCDDEAGMSVPHSHHRTRVITSVSARPHFQLALVASIVAPAAATFTPGASVMHAPVRCERGATERLRLLELLRI